MNSSLVRIFPFFVAGILSWIAIIRTDFSLEGISIPLMSQRPNSFCGTELSQSYRFLGKGRQSFVFVSEDGKTVLKFFNKRYIQMPWYAFFLPSKEKERTKRALRESFYQKSYLLAEQYLKQETALLYVHLGRTDSLPVITVVDRASRSFAIDLNEVPFVLQKRGSPLYPSLQEIYAEQGKEGLKTALDLFLQLIANRISLGLGDADHDVEHNFGFLDGKPMHLDPGRLFVCDLSKEERLQHEWWSATHSLRRWLEACYPEVLDYFDKHLKFMSFYTNRNK